MDFDDFWHDLKRRRAARGLGVANLIAWRRVPSSHQTARRLVQEYGSEDSAPPEIDIVAFEQSAGHGREGRPWSSPPSAGVYASLVRSIDSDLMPKLPMLVPVVLAEGLSRLTDGRCRIKWPNDLVVDGAKLGGILIDAAAQGERHAAVISFGINVAQDLTAFDQAHATSLGALGGADADAMTPASIFDDLLVGLEQALAASTVDLVARYRSLSAHREGESVRWRQAERELEGVFRGFDEHGRLGLEVAGDVQWVAAGSLIASGSADESA